MDKKEEIRIRIKKLLRDKKLSLTSISLKIGRHRAYLQQYIKYGTPERLEEKDRKELAEILNINEQELTDIQLSVISNKDKVESATLVEKVVRVVNIWLKERNLDIQYSIDDRAKLVRLVYTQYVTNPMITDTIISQFMDNYETIRKDMLN